MGGIINPNDGLLVGMDWKDMEISRLRAKVRDLQAKLKTSRSKWKKEMAADLNRQRPNNWESWT